MGARVTHGRPEPRTETRTPTTIGYVEAVLGEHFSYTQPMGMLALTVLLAGAAVIALGPEAHAVGFGKEDAVG